MIVFKDPQVQKKYEWLEFKAERKRGELEELEDQLKEMDENEEKVEI